MLAKFTSRRRAHPFSLKRKQVQSCIVLCVAFAASCSPSLEAVVPPVGPDITAPSETDAGLQATATSSSGQERVNVRFDWETKLLTYQVDGAQPLQLDLSPHIQAQPTEQELGVVADFIYHQTHTSYTGGLRDHPGCNVIGRRAQTVCTTVCCASHDECFHRHGCGLSSWIGLPTGSFDWGSCVACNASVVSCFLNPACHASGAACSLGAPGPSRECGCKQTCYDRTAGRYCADSCIDETPPTRTCVEAGTGLCAHTPPVVPRQCEVDPAAAGCSSSTCSAADPWCGGPSDAGPTVDSFPDAGVSAPDAGTGGHNDASSGNLGTGSTPYI